MNKSLMCTLFLILIAYSIDSSARTNKVLVECTWSNTAYYEINLLRTKDFQGLPGIDLVYMDQAFFAVTVVRDQIGRTQINVLDIKGDQVTIDHERTIFIGDKIGSDQEEGTETFNASRLNAFRRYQGQPYFKHGTCSFRS